MASTMASVVKPRIPSLDVAKIMIRSTKFKDGLNSQLRINIKIFICAIPNKVCSLYTYWLCLQVFYKYCFYYMDKFYLVISLKSCFYYMDKFYLVISLKLV